MLVAEDLHLDVARVDDELLEVHLVVAEGALGLAAGVLVGGVQLVRRLHQAHALAAAAGRRLQHHGIADLLGQPFGGVDVQAALRAGNEGHAGALHVLAGAGLGAHHLHRLGEGPMNLKPASAQARAKPAFSERNP